MKTPNFWKQNNWLSNILLPLSTIYATATKLRIKLHSPYKAKCPVICIGNLTAGGTGKTPVSLSVAEMLQNMGKKPFFISRGYGGRIHNVMVNKQVHTPVMDDGFQNPGLYKNISFLVFDGNYGIGNGRVIPAGPLREPLDNGLIRAQAAIILGEDKTNIASKINLPIFYGKITEQQPENTSRPVLAFAGIGHPEKFYNSLAKCGLNVVKTHNFPDHYFYTRAELNKLIEYAKKHDLDIYTTSKDFVKIPLSLQKEFKVLQIKVRWQNPDKLKDFLQSVF